MFARKPRTRQVGPDGSVLHLKVRNGQEFRDQGGPAPEPIVASSAATVGLMGVDYPDLSFAPAVSKGDVVSQGQVVCSDRRTPQITLTAPVAGRIALVSLGARRRLDALVIEPEGTAAVSFDVGAALQDGDALRALLQASGDWVAFRTRPFGRVPQSFSKPHAIFVTATDTRAHAADPIAILEPLTDAFDCGVGALTGLTDGKVFVCQPEGAPVAAARDRLVTVQVSGPHPAGLAGTHIHSLFPVSDQRHVWQIGYQDVVAIGHLLMTGQTMGTRVLSLAGDSITAPQWIRAPLGASLMDLTQGQLTEPEAILLSGSLLDGRALPYVGRRDLQVTAGIHKRPSKQQRSILWRMLDQLPDTRNGVMMPTEALERVFPFALLPAPLMRALATGDVEGAQRLGCLELLDEDVALLSAACPSGTDYGALLRRVHDAMVQERGL